MINLKIQGTNPIINAYQKQQQKSIDRKHPEQSDKINISEEAKSLQKTQQHEVNRKQFVQKLKAQVQSDSYEVNHERVAEKMIQFWKKD